jgi:FkbM family methyltransferase
VLRRIGVDVVLDVGANRGQFATELRNTIGFAGRIISFEPEPVTAEALRVAARADPAWDVYELALGDEEGRSELHTFAGSTWNSLHDIDDDQLGASGRSIKRTGRVPCDVRRLDQLWPEMLNPKDVVFVKVDTQGHELAVLRGAGSQLSHVSGLLLEASIQPFYESEPDLVVTLEEAARVGFRPSGFFPVVRRSSGALDTLDVCFVRTDGPAA